MKEFNTSLLREKFVIHDPNAKTESSDKAVIALSNRVAVELKDDKGAVQEVFIVRAQNMHSCVRMAARIVQSFNQGGPIQNRNTSFDWESAWDSIVNDYEYAFNPQRWIAIYTEGKSVFKKGEIHPLLDLIEKCDHGNDDAYDDAIPLAEDMFKKTGKVVKIEYDGNVALVVNMDKKEARCGVILRGPDRTTTFNFSVAKNDDKSLNFAQCLTASAAFLEGIQLGFMVGMNNMKIQLGIIERHSKEEKQTREARQRLSRLTAEIANLESAFDVNYRPERPEFNKVVMESERMAAKILEPPEGSGFVS